MHFFSPDYLFQTTVVQPSGFFLALTIGFGVLLVASILAYWRRAKLAPGNPVKRRFIRRAAKAGMYSALTGLVLSAMRYLQVDYLSWPFWMYLLLCTMIGIVAYFVYEASERYPLAVWQLQESHLERRFRPTAKARPEAPRRRDTNRQRGKRRK